MTVEAILGKVMDIKPELNNATARAVATDIYYGGEDPQTILATKSVIDKLISGYESRQAAAGARSVVANDPTVCSICKLPLKPVKLADGRSAVYCAKHFVVFPSTNKEK